MGNLAVDLSSPVQPADTWPASTGARPLGAAETAAAPAIRAKQESDSRGDQEWQDWQTAVAELTFKVRHPWRYRVSALLRRMDGLVR
jgi:hypothetical protein